MAKQYGLILPEHQKKKLLLLPVERKKVSIFDESNESSSDEDSGPKLNVKSSTSGAIGPGAMERRIARQMQAKALAEDPTVFQYDELFDDMDAKREAQEQSKSQEPKKPKYIGRLMKFAERRKLENELRVERQVQKEREAEGEEFKDKESFVTAAYRKKLEEMRQLEEVEKRDEYLETVGDVTKQKDLDGFYRHIYEQKLGTANYNVPKTSAGDGLEITGYKPIKSGKVPQQRAYRKRQASEDEEEPTAQKPTDAVLEGSSVKKVHLQNNIDADSDFSIDSDSSSEGEEDDQNKASSTKMGKTGGKSDKGSSALAQTDPTKIALDLTPAQPQETQADTNAKAQLNQEDVPVEIAEPAKPKRDKREIWQKRTVGAAFEAAVQRYYERKSARSAA